MRWILLLTAPLSKSTTVHLPWRDYPRRKCPTRTYSTVSVTALYAHPMQAITAIR